jgi:hypothetical protein
MAKTYSCLSLLFPGVYCFLLVAAALPVLAQDGTELVQGYQPSKVYHVFDFDSVSIPNEYLNLHIPLISYPQRGRMPDVRLFLVYHLSSWHYVQSGSSYTWQMNSGPGVLPAADPSLYAQRFYNAPSRSTIWHAVDSSGAQHALGWTSATNTEAIDGSGIYRNTSTQVLTDRDGLQYRTSNGLVQDQNGNVITA